MDEIVREETLFLNSNNRDSGEIYDSHFHIPPSLFQHKQSEYQILKLISFTCKHSWYNIDSNRNNTFTYREDSSDVTCTLTPGNYDVTELATEIQIQLNAIATNYSYVVSYTNATHKYTYTRTLTGSSKTVSFVFDSSLETEELLGFLTDATFSGSTLTSTQIVSIGNEENLFIRCNQALTYAITSSGLEKTNIFSKIPILQPLFGVIHWEMITDNRVNDIVLLGSHGNTLSFRITNENNRVIQLQSNYTMTLRIQTLKKEKFSINKAMKTISLLLLSKRK